MKTREQIEQFIIDNYKGQSYPNEYLKEDIYENIDEIRDDIVECLNVEIIYYSNAIEYLKENDTSLHESLRIAEDYGYELKNLSSEVLASLLASENEREIWYEFENELENFLNDETSI